jgi:hypothetical protein
MDHIGLHSDKNNNKRIDRNMTKTVNQIQQLSDIAWIVYHGDKRTGILNEDVQGKYTYITGAEIVHLDNDNAVQAHFGNTKIFEEQITSSHITESEYYLRGFRIYHDDPHPLEPDHPNYDPDIPKYTKTADSDICYAAGWYTVKFEKCWKHGSGPKFSTLQKYGFTGPYKTEQECKLELKRLNKERKAAL